MSDRGHIHRHPTGSPFYHDECDLTDRADTGAVGERPRTEAAQALMRALRTTYEVEVGPFIEAGFVAVEQEASGGAVGEREEPPLDVERLGYHDLLNVADAILRHYPPDTIVCSHHVKADPGAKTTAAIADLVASARLSVNEGGVAPDPFDDVKLASFFHQEYWEAANEPHRSRAEATSSDCEVCWASADRLHAVLESGGRP